LPYRPPPPESSAAVQKQDNCCQIQRSLPNTAQPVKKPRKAQPVKHKTQRSLPTTKYSAANQKQARAQPAVNKIERSPPKTRVSAACQKQDTAQPAETIQPQPNTAQPIQKPTQGPRINISGREETAPRGSEWVVAAIFLRREGGNEI